MLPQTNLQLYWLLRSRGADDDCLTRAAAAYDAARRLFAAAFRANGKHFLAHLTGCAGALALWGQTVDVVAAGLTHSAYLFGAFADGERGVTPPRRRWLSARIGADAEALVAAYTTAVWTDPLAELAEAARRHPLQRTLLTIKLADVLDEISDSGPAYTPERAMHFGARGGPAGEQRLVELAEAIVGAHAAAQFREAFDRLHRWTPPPEMQTPARAFTVLDRQVRLPRCAPWQGRLARAARRVLPRRSA